MKKPLVLFLIICLVLSQDLIAQDKTDHGKKSKTKSSKEKNEDEENKVVRWNFGINVGGYAANKFPAGFYNGSPQNVNSLHYILSNYYWYQEIYHNLKSIDTVMVSGFPSNMHYSLAMMGGFFLRYNLDRKNSICLDANYCQLKATDAITLEVDPDPYSLKPADIRLCPVQGREYRVNIDLAYQRSFPLKSRISLFVQGGFVMNYTKVQKSIVVIADKEYDMINIYGSQYYIPNSNLQENSIIQGGFGYGLFAGGGADFPLTDMFGIEPGAFVQYYNVNLEGYNKYKPSFGFYIRIMFGNILSSPEPD